MTELLALILGIFAGSRITLDPGRIADLQSECETYRAALGYLMRSSREPAVRRYIARVLDPDGQEAGA